MSLATTGGGGLGGGGAVGGGGMVMAHQVHSANVPPPPTHTGATAPPPSAAFLGADLLDKSHGLTLKNVKNVAHLPIVAVDLHGSEAHVALFPKKPEDPSKGVPPVAVSKLSTDIMFQKGDLSHKTLRKYLGKSKSFASFKTDCWTSKSQDAVVLKKPHRWLGLRRINDASEFIRTEMLVEESSGPEIAEEVLQGVGVCVSNGSLDGSLPTGDDFDRVVFKVRLHDSKKATTILPEEAVEMLLHQAKCMVAVKIKADPDDEEVEDFPVVVAMPAWAFHDAAVEAMMDAIGGSGVLVQRNVAALAGALLPSLDGKATPLLDRLNMVHGALQKQHQKHLMKDPDAHFEDEITLLVFGMTGEGFEMTAIQISSLNMENISSLFGVFKVISNVSFEDSNPISRMQDCAKKLEETVETIAPEADGPAGIILCGTIKEQKQIISHWEKVKNEEWAKVPLFFTADDCVAKGAAVLGAVSHGRLSHLEHAPGQKARRAGLAIRVQNVAPVALGIQMNYHGGANDKWTPVKIIFDFDRQIPAGPKSLDLNAAECAVYRSGKDTEGISEEELLKLIKMNEGSKGIPQREEAALNFCVRILQKWTRDGEWMQVGDTMEPLVQKSENKDGSFTRIGCERVTWELSVGVNGMITTAFVGERESVVVATKSARNSAIRYYLGILFAILFFGGFLFKSYWDEYVLNRDTERLLAYYKRVLPGSYHDGDVHSARYTCYKYRHKKAKLWRNLEKKYGIPVLTVKEYEELDIAKTESSGKQSDSDEETVDLDETENAEETTQEL